MGTAFWHFFLLARHIFVSALFYCCHIVVHSNHTTNNTCAEYHGQAGRSNRKIPRSAESDFAVEKSKKYNGRRLEHAS